MCVMVCVNGLKYHDTSTMSFWVALENLDLAPLVTDSTQVRLYIYWTWTWTLLFRLKPCTTSVQLKIATRIYGIKVSFWGSGTLKIVIPVENYPQKRSFRLADHHPPVGGGVLISGQNLKLTIYIHIGG